MYCCYFPIFSDFALIFYQLFVCCLNNCYSPVFCDLESVAKVDTGVQVQMVHHNRHLDHLTGAIVFLPAILLKLGQQKVLNVLSFALRYLKRMIGDIS